MIQPTVGRVVLFSQMTADIFPGSHGRCAAIVTYVHSDRMVNLTVFDANGGVHSRTSVALVQDGDERPKHMHCEWMAYQKGQAAKTEALESKLAGK